VTCAPAAAQSESVLYSFGVNLKSPWAPFDAPIFDAAGNLYGTTIDGGNFNYGSVFELSPTQTGIWKAKVLHSFANTGNGGYMPIGGLAIDAAGNLYGTTYSGGSHGGGTLFELLPQANGSWSSKLVHEFASSAADGKGPQATLIFDGAGNLYGTTSSGGTHNQGTVFEFSLTTSGNWQEKVLHSFNGAHGDGIGPNSSLVLDASGNLYGTTNAGGKYAYWGTVYEVSPAAGGGWTEKVLHSFSNTSTDGGSPEAAVILDSAGNVYGTTLVGGANSAGIVFELSPPTSGGYWNETIVHNFDNNGTDGFLCVSPLVFDHSGNLYGTTNGGGTYGNGTLYELSPSGSGTWTETIVHNFDADHIDGSVPIGGVVFDAEGNLWGMTSQGGAYGGGVAFEITP
jgi:uncharacterized repeat protein (TIGR03803 family)